MKAIKIPIVISVDSERDSYRADIYGSTVALGATPQLALYKAGTILGSLETEELVDLKAYYEKIEKLNKEKER